VKRERERANRVGKLDVLKGSNNREEELGKTPCDMQS
jgi:hypothetical protein